MGRRLWLVAFGWLFCATLAQAQIVLFDQANLQGNKLTVRSTEPDLGGSDFKGKARSLSVVSGTWEVCVGADHRGDCTQFAKGDYPELDRRFVGTIASVRPVVQANVAAPPAVIVVQPPVAPAPSSCSVSATEACSACRVSCTNGRQAICTKGTEFPKLIGKPAECAMESQCGCR